MRFKEYKKEIMKAIDIFKELPCDDWKIEKDLIEILEQINNNENIVTLYSKIGHKNVNGEINIGDPYLYIAYDEKYYDVIKSFLDTTDITYQKSEKTYYDFFNNIKFIKDELDKLNLDIIKKSVKCIIINGKNHQTNYFWDEMKKLAQL
jgi:hypothetical protein